MCAHVYRRRLKHTSNIEHRIPEHQTTAVMKAEETENEEEKRQTQRKKALRAIQEKKMKRRLNER